MRCDREVSLEFERDYRKTCHRNASFRREVGAKVSRILEDPLRFKPLRAPMQGLRRVHVAGSCVMIFEPDPPRKVVRFLRLAHHDEAYGM